MYREERRWIKRVHHQETSCYQHLQFLYGGCGFVRPACWYISAAHEISDICRYTNILPFPAFVCCAGFCNIQRIKSGVKERSEIIHS